MGSYANFYNSVNGDRKYDAESFSEWLKPFFVSGVFNGGFQVLANNGDMSVNVNPGYVNINGKTKFFETEKRLTLDAADATLSRIDNIIIRRDDTTRDFSILVQKGTFANIPVAPVYTRNTNIYDLVIAQVLIGPAKIVITQADVTDTRMNSALCGWVASTVTEINFDQITAQFEDFKNQFKIDNYDEFNTWFQTMKAQLSSDAAGNLQNQLDTVYNNLNETNTNLQSQITANTNNSIKKSSSTGVTTTYIWSGTQAQYDAIATKNNATLYFIEE